MEARWGGVVRFNVALLYSLLYRQEKRGSLKALDR
jgi:hypothetical protein